MNDKIIYIDDNNKLNLSRLSPIQQAFIKSNKLHSGIKGGYQSGKSISGTVKSITKLLQNPNVPIAYYLPTYGLIEDMLIPKFTKLFNDIEVPFTHNKSESKIICPYGEIWMRSMDNPDRIVSYSVGYSLIDEVDIVHINRRKDVMKRISSRNSFKTSGKNCIDFVCTPEGYGYMHNFFIEKADDNKVLYTLKTLDNKDNLGDGYIDGLRSQYDERLLQAYLDGEFVNLNSESSYYKFDRDKNHSDEYLKDHDTLYIGMDFNVGNMHAVVHVIKDKPIAVDEIVEVNDTEEICGVIKERFPKNRIIIYPDSSGKSKSTNADKTDIQILKSAGFIVKYRSTNPLVKDRVKNMNRMFCNGKGEIGYLVNTRKCVKYTKALEQIANDKNGVPNKAGGLDHITEAGGYFIYYEYPLKTEKKFKVKKR